MLLNMLIYIFYFLIISYVSNSTLEEVRNCLKEVAYSYYMRGKYIQYNTHKAALFSPEEATSQKINYCVCSNFVKNVYLELLNITIPSGSQAIVNYAKNNIGSPESILYSNITEDNVPQFFLYAPNEKKKYKILKKFSIEDLISIGQVGDVIAYNDHAQLIYDIEKDSNGKVKDLIIMESTGGIGGSIVNSKCVPEILVKENGDRIYHHLGKLFLNNKLNAYFEEGLEQGSIGLIRLSTSNTWKRINNSETRQKEYCFLRFVNSDSKGNAILKYKTTAPKKPNQFLNDDLIKLSPKSSDRLKKFKHLFIEKTVNANNNNIVGLGDILSYKIIVKNMHKNNYKEDLIITEYLSEFVSYELHYESKEITSFNYDINNRVLKWNLGKLQKNESIIVNYIVKVISGKPKDIIKSTGLVGNIPSAIIKNTIGVSLNKNQKQSIEKNFEKLKKKFDGKKLINEIYKYSFQKDIKFDKFEITNLINNTNLTSTALSSIYLNKNNAFYGAVLNNQWSAMTNMKHAYIIGGSEVNIFTMKGFGDYENPERRADFIFKEAFKTGDILIYKNKNDMTYKADKDNKLISNRITYENGEYAFIYIESKGFVGINIGDDKEKNTKDDRNEFNVEYYKKNNLTLYLYSTNPSDELLEIVNYQTLFGKDYYVILRPSLIFEFKVNDSKTATIVFLILFSLFVLLCLLYILLKFIKMRKDGKEFSFTNLKQELLFNYKLKN